MDRPAGRRSRIRVAAVAEGFSLFYLRGVASAEVGTLDIYRGVTPFVIIQLIALALLAIYPAMATWLPKLVFG